ncbi:MAG: methyl-accepting chemotaxis protein [Limisphaerales bacterium]
MSTRPLDNKGHGGIYLLRVLLVVVIAVFVAWTIGMLRHNVVAFKEPVAELRSVLDRVGKGDFTIDVHLKRKDEFADLANGIIAMTRNLALMIDRLHQNANAVAQAAKTILSATGHQQKAVDQIEHVTEFLAEAGSKIHFSASQLANTISVVGQASDAASRLGESGTAGLGELDGAMKVISDSSEAINSKLENLNEKAGAVSRVVSTMSKVADQTNLLSINAAIEAEKAGESGKGFAVVASEIQRLADRTAQDADEVEQLVKEMQKAVAAGVIGTEQFDNDVRAGTEGLTELTATVEGIARQIEAIKPQVEIISNSMQAQSEGARQLQARSHSLDEAMKDSAESAHEMRAAVQQLESAAHELEDGKSRFNFIN